MDRFLFSELKPEGIYVSSLIFLILDFLISELFQIVLVFNIPDISNPRKFEPLKFVPVKSIGDEVLKNMFLC